MEPKYDRTSSDAEEDDPYKTTFGPSRKSPDDAITSSSDPQPIMNQPYPYPAPQHYYPAPYPGPPPINTTTVIVQQQSQSRPPRGWSSRLCECGKDWSICCCGFFCTCCLEVRVSRDMGESACLPRCVPGWLIVLRTKMRIAENINGSVMDDCCTTHFCGLCSLCQLAYEIEVVRERDRALGTPLNVV